MKRLNLYLIFVTSILLHMLALQTAIAVPAAPLEYKIQQPDGSSFWAISKGDEWGSWVETVEGYTIDMSTDGTWYYVSSFKGSTAVLDETPAHEKPPATLKKHIKPLINRPDDRTSDYDIYKQKNIDSNSVRASASQASNGPLGEFTGKIIFILVQFEDRTGIIAGDNWAPLINENIHDYYKKTSHGNVTLLAASETFGETDDGVVGWIDIGYKHPDFRNNKGKINQRLAKDAIIKADDYVDFSSYDSNHDGFVDSNELAVVIIQQFPAKV